MTLSGGNVHDCRGFEELYRTVDQDNVIEAAAIDKAYDSNEIRDQLAKDGIESVISPKANRKQTILYDVQLYKERNKVERFFCKLKEFRRVATRYDKLKCSFFCLRLSRCRFYLLKIIREHH